MCYAHTGCLSWSWIGTAAKCYLFSTSGKQRFRVKNEGEVGFTVIGWPIAIADRSAVDEVGARSGTNNAMVPLYINFPQAFCRICIQIVTVAEGKGLRSLQSVLRLVSNMCPRIPFVHRLCVMAIRRGFSRLLTAIIKKFPPVAACRRVRICKAK